MRFRQSCFVELFSWISVCGAVSWGGVMSDFVVPSDPFLSLFRQADWLSVMNLCHGPSKTDPLLPKCYASEHSPFLTALLAEISGCWTCHWLVGSLWKNLLCHWTFDAQDEAFGTQYWTCNAQCLNSVINSIETVVCVSFFWVTFFCFVF